MICVEHSFGEEDEEGGVPTIAYPFIITGMVIHSGGIVMSPSVILNPFCTYMSKVGLECPQL